MKKSIVTFCAAALCVAAFAQECTPAPEAPKPECPARQQMRPHRARPAVLVIDEKATAETVEAYKKEVCEKIDAAFAGYAAKEAPEGCGKAPVNIMLMVNERPMRQGKMGPRGPRGEGMGEGPKGPHHHGRHGEGKHGEGKCGQGCPDQLPPPPPPAPEAE